MAKFPVTARATFTKTSGVAAGASVSLEPDQSRFLIAAKECVAPTQLVCTVVPTISGTPQVGQTLTASGTGTWTGANGVYTYEWQQDNSGSGDWENIKSGNGASTFVPTVAQQGLKIRVRVRGINGAGPRYGASLATVVVAAA